MVLTGFVVSLLLAIAHVGAYTNPVNQQNGADPCLRYIDGVYYLTTTQNTDISMWSATTIEGLKTGTKKVLFTDSTAGRNFDFWAPEFWYLNGRWYIYYAVAGNNDDNTHRMHVLGGGTNSSNPMSGTYTYLNSLVPSNFNAWAVDGSILQLNSSLYFLFSGKVSDNPWTQCTYIVPMSSPTAFSGAAVQISCPTLDWEKLVTPVQEGPEVLSVGGVTHIVYSGSHCYGDDYALGLLTLTTGANPLLASSWIKKSTPIFTKNVAASVYGPGHHFMFQKNNNWYFAYHAKNASWAGCGDVRTTRVQPFTISGTTPVFPTAVAAGVSLTEPV